MQTLLLKRSIFQFGPQPAQPARLPTFPCVRGPEAQSPQQGPAAGTSPLGRQPSSLLSRDQNPQAAGSLRNPSLFSSPSFSGPTGGAAAGELPWPALLGPPPRHGRATSSRVAPLLSLSSPCFVLAEAAACGCPWKRWRRCHGSLAGARR